LYESDGKNITVLKNRAKHLDVLRCKNKAADIFVSGFIFASHWGKVIFKGISWYLLNNSLKYK